MHLLEAAIKETLRLRAPATEHDRVCVKDCVVNGDKIPKNTTKQEYISIKLQTTHSNHMVNSTHIFPCIIVSTYLGTL